MDLLLTGTGPASGFPVPGCSCATCRWAAGTGSARRPAELRLGERYRLDVHTVVHEPDGTSHRLHPGERLDRPGITVRALASAGSASCLLVHADGERPLLWAPQAGALPPSTTAELTGIRLGPVFLGPGPDVDPDGPGPASTPVQRALTLAQLRAIGAVDDRSTALLVGLGHRQGPAERLAVCQAHWRLPAPPGGARPTPADLPAALTVPFLGARTLVLGGSASGKSALAEDLLAAEPEVLYTATGPPADPRPGADPEWAQRVRRHRERRPSWWRTEETHLVAPLLAKVEQPI